MTFDVLSNLLLFRHIPSSFLPALPHHTDGVVTGNAECIVKLVDYESHELVVCECFALANEGIMRVKIKTSAVSSPVLVSH